MDFYCIWPGPELEFELIDTPEKLPNLETITSAVSGTGVYEKRLHSLPTTDLRDIISNSVSSMKATTIRDNRPDGLNYEDVNSIPINDIINALPAKTYEKFVCDKDIYLNCSVQYIAKPGGLIVFQITDNSTGAVSEYEPSGYRWISNSTKNFAHNFSSEKYGKDVRPVGNPSVFVFNYLNRDFEEIDTFFITNFNVSRRRMMNEITIEEADGKFNVKTKIGTYIMSDSGLIFIRSNKDDIESGNLISGKFIIDSVIVAYEENTDTNIYSFAFNTRQGLKLFRFCPSVREFNAMFAPMGIVWE